MAAFYSRKATVTIEADAHPTPAGCVIAVRPSVKAVGPFRLHFADQHGAVVQLFEILSVETGTDFGEEWPEREAFPQDELKQHQFVSPDETLTSSFVYKVDSSKPDLLGWIVALSVASKGGLRNGLHWGDRVFVPVPQ